MEIENWEIENCPSCGERLPRTRDAFCTYCQESLEEKKTEHLDAGAPEPVAQNPFGSPQVDLVANNTDANRLVGPTEIGCALGGCLAPILLMMLSGLLGGLGSPVFWPFIAIVLGAIGAAIGASYRRS